MEPPLRYHAVNAPASIYGTRMRPKSSPPVLSHPFSAVLLTSSLTVFRALNREDCFSCAALPDSKAFCNSSKLRILTTSATETHIFFLHTALAPRGSDCFLPCNDPLISVSCKWGFQTAEMLLPNSFSEKIAACLRENK